MTQQWYWGYGAPPSAQKRPQGPPKPKKKAPEMPRMSNGRWFKPLQSKPVQNKPVSKKAHNCAHAYCGQCGVKNQLPKLKYSDDLFGQKLQMTNIH